MINIENTEVTGWEHAIRGMRNPMNSWDKSDSHVCNSMACDFGYDCPMVENDHEPAVECNDGAFGYCVGEADYELMKRLTVAGSDHRKFLRMITVYADITAPLYLWKEFDTYKVGTVANSCSTMHKIHAKEFTMDDFSHEHLHKASIDLLEDIIAVLNTSRKLYLHGFRGVPGDNAADIEPRDKAVWWQMIQLLPSSYNQKRTVMLNYEVLRNMYHARRSHKLDEWRTFCEWIEKLPYSELICGGGMRNEAH